MSDRPERCSLVEDGKVVQPCHFLAAGVESSFARGSRRQGLQLITLVNIRTREKARTFVAVRSGEYGKSGVAINFCPFCGEDINTFDKEPST